MATLDLNAKYSSSPDEDNDSRKYMMYLSDSGVAYAVQISEAIGETFGFADVTDADNFPALPTGFDMRRIHAASGTGKIRQSFPVGDPTFAAYREGGTVAVARKGKAAGVVLSFTGTTGEKKRFVSGKDTGQQNNDNT